MKDAAQSQYLPILQVVYTKDQAISFDKQIDQLLIDIFNPQNSFEERLSKLVSLEQREVLLTVLHAHNIALTDTVRLKEFLVGLKNQLDNLPIISLQIAFDPSASTLKLISHWFVSTLNRKYLLDIQIKREILGGIIIISHGIFKDFSLRKKIHDTYSHQDFLSLIEK